MNLIYVTNVRLPTDKAHGLQIMKSCEAFAISGARVHLIVPRLKPSYKEDPFGYYGIKHKFFIKKLFVLEILSLVKYLGSVAAYIQNLSFSLSAIIYLFFHPRLRKNSIIYSRDYMTLWWLCLFGFRPIAELHDYRTKTGKSRINFIIQHCRKLIVNSQGTLDALRSHYKIKNEKVLVAANGVDLGFFDIKTSALEAKHILHMPLDKPIVAYVGRLETVGMEKGVLDLLKAFSELISHYSQAVLYIVGGPDNLLDKYKKEAEKLDIDSKRIVFTGHVSYKDIPLYLRAIDIVVIPLPNNRHGSTTSPIKVFEFMAAGKAMIVSDLPTIRKELDEHSAVFFEAGDIIGLREKIVTVLNKKELSHQLSSSAYQLAKSRTWESRARKVLDFISDAN